MSLPTSDLHNPTVCLGNRYFRSITNESNYHNRHGMSITPIDFNAITLPIEPSVRLTPSNDNSSNVNNNSNLNNNNNNNSDVISSNNINNNNNNNNSGDLASVDSSDTYASCQTHPFLSQGDLTADPYDTAYAFDDFNVDELYLNSLEKKRATSIAGAKAPITSGGSIETDYNTNTDSNIKGQMKKSASGDASLHSFSPGAMEEVFKTFQSFEMATRMEDRGSHISLNETSVPKHRKTRFQQSSLNKLKTPRVDILTPKKYSQDNLNEKAISSSSPIHTKKNRRASFMPTKSLASATKLINQHLFGIQHIGSKGQIIIENI